MTRKLLFHRNISTKESSLSGLMTRIYLHGEKIEFRSNFKPRAGVEKFIDEMEYRPQCHLTQMEVFDLFGH